MRLQVTNVVAVAVAVLVLFSVFVFAAVTTDNLCTLLAKAANAAFSLSFSASDLKRD